MSIKVITSIVELPKKASADAERLSVLLLFDRLLARASSKGERVTRRALCEFLGTADLEAVLNSLARLGVAGILDVLNDALASMRAAEISEARARCLIRRDRRGRKH